MSGGEHREKQPETAVEEVLREVEEAEKRPGDEDASGEAGDAVTPNTGAQEQARGE
ncbi:hypothetical protein ACF1BE_07705 [Streptomyces sp. NPDC014991]|uniref:hypothetical protein n=1 Tax=Streptomyces sp. NPDC014991 TaxID=3364935 RepID=UPI0036FA51A7